MIVSRKYRLVYVCPPKTGSISFRELLLSPRFEGRLWDKRYDHHNTLWVPELADYFYFMTVRNPYARMFSFWKFVLMHASDKSSKGDPRRKCWRRYFPRPVVDPVSFERFVLQGPQTRKRIYREKWHRMMRTVWSCGWHLAQLQKPVDALLHLETLTEDVKQIPGLSEVIIDHKNQGPVKQKPWQDFYTPELVQAVQDLWPNDFEQFGYSRDLS